MFTKQRPLNPLRSPKGVRLIGRTRQSNGLYGKGITNPRRLTNFISTMFNRVVSKTLTRVRRGRPMRVATKGTRTLNSVISKSIIQVIRLSMFSNVRRVLVKKKDIIKTHLTNLLRRNESRRMRMPRRNDLVLEFWPAKEVSINRDYPRSLQILHIIREDDVNGKRLYHRFVNTNAIRTSPTMLPKLLLVNEMTSRLAKPNGRRVPQRSLGNLTTRFGDTLTQSRRVSRMIVPSAKPPNLTQNATF